jgi:hypothetical protein
MNTFLWTLFLVGSWNALNMIARIYYKAPWYPYAWHVIVGFWAAWLLFNK